MQVHNKVLLEMDMQVMMAREVHMATEIKIRPHSMNKNKHNEERKLLLPKRIKINYHLYIKMKKFLTVLARKHFKKMMKDQVQALF